MAVMVKFDMCVADILESDVHEDLRNVEFLRVDLVDAVDEFLALVFGEVEDDVELVVWHSEVGCGWGCFQSVTLAIRRV